MPLINKPPCTIIESAYLKNIESDLEKPRVIKTLKDIHQFLITEKIDRPLEWMMSNRLGVDEQLLFYPNAEIKSLSGFHEYLFIVKIKTRSEPGMGVALLRGDIRPAPLYIEQ